MIKKLYRFLSKRHQTIFLDYKVKFEPRYGHGKKAHQELYNLINAHRESYFALIDQILSNKERLQSIKKRAEEENELEPAYNNEFLPGLDIASLYTIISANKPRKYVEVGSGNSTKVAYKAKKEQQLEMEIISIDPHPRAEIDQLADTIIREPFETIERDIVNELESGDILFIDNSHRILPNSDSMVFFMEVLPRLKKGVIVHIHDIYLPFDYPQFMCDRAYSEQYGLAFFILANPERFKTYFPAYFVSEDHELSSKLDPLWQHPNLEDVEKHGGSYWLTIG